MIYKEVKYENKIQIYKYTRACAGACDVAELLLYVFLDTTAREADAREAHTERDRDA